MGEPSTTPPPYEEVYQQEQYQTKDIQHHNGRAPTPPTAPGIEGEESIDQEDTSHIEANNLTSIYEEEQDGLFGGISLFYFLIHSAFSALFPFLSVILYHHGFTYSQIGAVYTVTFFVSCCSATCWHYVADRTQSKHTVMLFSIAAWLLGYTPLLWLKHGDPFIHCDVKSSVNSTLKGVNQTKVFTITKENISLLPSKKTSYPTEQIFSEWYTLDYTFLTLITLLGVGRLIQSSTDYFYFEHERLLYPETISKKLSKPSYHISTRFSAAIITIFAGYVLDSILYCNQSMGHFQMAFYFFFVFGAFSLFILYFLDVTQFKTSNGCCTIRNSSSASSTGIHHTEGEKQHKIFKIFTLFGLIVLGASRAVYYTFLQLHLSKLGGLYFQIGAVFAVHKIVETCLRMFKKRLFSKLNMHMIFIIIFTMDSIRNLYISYIKASGLLVWFLLPMELLSGFSALLYPASPFSPSIASGGNQIGETAFTVSYWWIGYSFAPIVFGFASQRFSYEITFKIVALANLGFASWFSGCYFLQGDTSNCQENDNMDEDSDEHDFLMRKDNENEEIENS